MKFALQWTFYFDDKYVTGPSKNINVDDVINADDAFNWIDEHMLKLQQDLKVSCTEAPYHIDDDIEWNWRFFEGTITDLSCEEIDKIQWLSIDRARVQTHVNT